MCFIGLPNECPALTRRSVVSFKFSSFLKPLETCYGLSCTLGNITSILETARTTVVEFTIFKYNIIFGHTVNDRITTRGGYVSRGGYSKGALIKYCSVLVTRTEISTNQHFLFTLTRPKSNTMQVQCQLYNHQCLSKEISKRKVNIFLLIWSLSIQNCRVTMI